VPRLDANLEPVRETAARCAVQFRLRQRPQPQDRRSTGERLADRGDGQEVRRTCEQEAAGHRILVHDGLQGPHQAVPAELDLVDGQRMALVGQERAGILQRGQPRLLVVEGCVGSAPVGHDLLREGGLAALPGTVQHNHPEDVESLRDSSLQVTPYTPHEHDPTG